MKYKVGDKVRYEVGDKNSTDQYGRNYKLFLEKNNYIVTIRVIDEESSIFTVEGFDGWWGVAGIVEVIYEPIYSRWELLDL